MSRDSQASFVHLRSSHHVLYISNWVHDELRYDEVEIPGANLDEDNDSNDIQNTAFGATKSRKRNQEPAWKDLGLGRFMNDDNGFIDENRDKTLLTKLKSLHSMVNEERNSADDSFEGPHFDSTASTSFDNSILNTSSSSLSTVELTTPDVTRTRPVPQRNVQNFQTPITRIMR